MPSARIIVRKRIWDDEKLRRVLERRNTDNADGIARLLRTEEFSQPFKYDPDGNIDDVLNYANVSGLVKGTGLTEESKEVIDVRSRLLDKLSLLSEIPFPQKPDGKDQKRAAAQSEHVTDQGGTGARLVADYEPFPLPERFSEAEDSFGIDLSISPSYSEAGGNWSGAKNGKATFGTAADAMRLVKAPWASGSTFQVPPKYAKYDGSKVNVVIVDEGLNAGYLQSIHPGVNFFGGFISGSSAGPLPLPGQFFDSFKPAPSWHGNMIARNILRIAPNARIFDAPILPPRVTNIPAFTFDIEQLYRAIARARYMGPFPDEPWDNEPWIIVNAWAVADTISEYGSGFGPAFLYSIGDQHPTNRLIQLMGKYFDIVFAAGNFGEFAPVPGTGIYDRGFYRSIKGSNALSNVLTVGACDVTGRWIGTSSQGDGPQDLKYGQNRLKKPDLCAPSWYCENDDASAFSTGSSASCAVAAGIVAALRTTVHRTTAPAAFRTALRAKNPRSVTSDARLRAGRTVLTI